MPFYLSSDFDRPRFIKPPNVPAPQKFLITAYLMENVGRGEMKPVLHFSNTELGFILNTTNRRVLAEKLGDNMLGWVGKVIVIFPAMVEFESRMGRRARVRVPKQKESPPLAAAQAPLNPPNLKRRSGMHPTPRSASARPVARRRAGRGIPIVSSNTRRRMPHAADG